MNRRWIGKVISLVLLVAFVLFSLLLALGIPVAQYAGSENLAYHEPEKRISQRRRDSRLCARQTTWNRKAGCSRSWRQKIVLRVEPTQQVRYERYKQRWGPESSMALTELESDL